MMTSVWLHSLANNPDHVNPYRYTGFINPGTVILPPPVRVMAILLTVVALSCTLVTQFYPYPELRPANLNQFESASRPNTHRFLTPSEKQLTTHTPMAPGYM